MNDNTQSPDSPEAFLIIHGQIYPLSKKDINIGRGLLNDVVIQSEAVSRVHAQIKYEADQYVIFDDESTGGSFVNNSLVNRCVLHSGDVIRLADTQIMFMDNQSRISDHARTTTRGLDQSAISNKKEEDNDK